MPVLETKGALSAQGYGLTTSRPQPAYIEDVFSTWLYTGNGSRQGIPNGMRLNSGATLPGWFLTLGDSGGQAALGVTADSSDNIYISGRSNTFIGSFRAAFLTVKFDSNGVPSWQRANGTFANPAQEGLQVKVDISNNVYVAGMENPGFFLLQKYDSSGVLQWSARSQLGDFSGMSQNGLAVTSSGTVYVAGYTYDPYNTNGAQILKFNTSGTLVWQRRFALSQNEQFEGIAVDSSENVYATGSTSNTGITSFFTAKLNSGGTQIWQRYLAIPSIGQGAEARAIAVSPSGDSYVVGPRFAAGSPICLVKYDTNGNVSWQREFFIPNATNVFPCVTIDSSENVYISGFSNFSGESGQGFIVSYNSSGTLRWQRSVIGAGGAGCALRSIAAQNNYIYITGDTFSSNKGQDIILGKLPADGSGVGAYTLGDLPVTYAPANFSFGSGILENVSTSLPIETTTFTASLVSPTAVIPALPATLTPLIEEPLTPTSTAGLVWMKGRSGATAHALYDTARGATFEISSNSTGAQLTESTGLTGFLSNGFSIGSLLRTNTNAATYASWTFREQPKFFDIVTYTGNGANRTIAHSLGSVPGCIMVKRTDASADWQVYHRSLANTQYMVLNSTAAAATGATRWNSTTPTSTVFSLGTDATVNANGGTYVAYIFAHDAGGFGATGADNVISCGSYTGSGFANAPTITLGYEPQWLLVKRATGGTGDWNLIDNMRGFDVSGTASELNPNLANAESTGFFVAPSATRFQLKTGIAEYNASGSTYIYIAIRRGPMRTPTSGTSVLELVSRTGNATFDAQVGTSVLTDLALIKAQTIEQPPVWGSRLTGGFTVQSNSDAPELVSSRYITYGRQQVGVRVEGFGPVNADTFSYINYLFRRAPGFFDVVCYTGTGANATQAHNLGVAPELMIVKSRSTGDWQVYSSALANTEYLVLNTTAAKATGATRWNSTTPTSSVFSLGTANEVNEGNIPYIAYLFASAPGVSKVGSYTGTGATQTINCGFAAGARFVLIKRTDASGGWHVWDSARGIVAGSDPYLLLNSAAAQVTNTDWVDTAASGFELSNDAGNLVNTNGGSYIFLAIA